MPGYIIDKERKAANARARSASVNDSSSRRGGGGAAAKKGEYEMFMVGHHRPGDRESRAGYLMVPQWRGQEDHYDDDGADVQESRQKNGPTVVTTRQRSASAAAAGSSSSSKPKEFAEGLKRRIGSLRRK